MIIPLEPIELPGDDKVIQVSVLPSTTNDSDESLRLLLLLVTVRFNAMLMHCDLSVGTTTNKIN